MVRIFTGSRRPAAWYRARRRRRQDGRVALLARVAELAQLRDFLRGSQAPDPVPFMRNEDAGALGPRALALEQRDELRDALRLRLRQVDRLAGIRVQVVELVV